MNDYLQNNLSRIDLEKYLTPQKSPPFNSSTPRVDPVKTNNNPGPGSYNIKSIDSGNVKIMKKRHRSIIS